MVSGLCAKNGAVHVVVELLTALKYGTVTISRFLNDLRQGATVIMPRFYRPRTVQSSYMSQPTMKSDENDRFPCNLPYTLTSDATISAVVSDFSTVSIPKPPHAHTKQPHNLQTIQKLRNRRERRHHGLIFTYLGLYR